MSGIILAAFGAFLCLPVRAGFRSDDPSGGSDRPSPQPRRPPEGLHEILERALVELDWRLEGKSARALSTEERRLLNGIFQDTVDLSSIRLVRVPGKEEGATSKSFRIGERTEVAIFLSDRFRGAPQFDPDGALAPEGLANLVHEAVHAWQVQNGRDFEDRTRAARDEARLELASAPPEPGRTLEQSAEYRLYDWRRYADRGVSFSDLNKEAQARLIEDWFRDRDGELARGLYAAYVRRALWALRAGAVDPS